MDKFIELKEQYEEERKALVKYLQIKEQDTVEVDEVKEIDDRIAKYKKVIKVYDRILRILNSI